MATKKNKKKRRLLILLSIVGIILLLIAGKKSGLLWKEPLDQVTVESPEVRTIIELISANGRIQPVTEVKISPDVSGEIVELNVQEGQYVEKGKLLLRIKPDTYQSMQERATASVNSSKAQLEQTKTQLALAEQTYKRQKQLFEQKAISEADYQSAEAQYRGLEAQVRTSEFNIRSAEASLKEAAENLYKTTIYAPSSGTVSKLNNEQGERVVGTATMAGTEIMRLADLSQMEVRAEVNENDIVRVHLGDTATIEVDAYLGRKFKGVVTRIANTASGAAGTDQVTNFEVRIYILPDSYADLKQEGVASPFRPGMSASVDIQTKTLQALSVPIQAVTTRNIENSSKEVVFIYQADSMRVKQVPVTTGIQDKQYIQIKADTSSKFTLDTTIQVVTGPFTAISKRLFDGQQVQTTPSLTRIAGEAQEGNN